MIHIFVNEALLCASLYTKVKQGGTAPMQTMSREDLLSECAFISGVLRNEFVYGTENIETNVDRTIQLLKSQEVLGEDTSGAGAAQAANKIGLAQMERERGRDSFDSYLFLIWPFVESYWLAACSLLLLAPPGDEPPHQQQQKQSSTSTSTQWFAAKEFEKKAQLFGKTLYQQGEIAYLEVSRYCERLV